MDLVISNMICSVIGDTYNPSLSIEFKEIYMKQNKFDTNNNIKCKTIKKPTLDGYIIPCQIQIVVFWIMLVILI